MAINPYIGLLGVLAEEKNKTGLLNVCLGKVISKQPLVIRTGDLLLDKDDMLFSEHIVSDKIMIDDIFALLPILNMQKYITLCKVVNL